MHLFGFDCTFYAACKTCMFDDGKMKHSTKVKTCQKLSYIDLFKFEQEDMNQGKSRP